MDENLEMTFLTDSFCHVDEPIRIINLETEYF
jgi:hypothetical protein